MQLARTRITSVTLALSTLVLAAPTLPPLGGNVLVVANGGTAPFTAIQAAVDAAIDGDVVLVRPGFYSGFLVTNKCTTRARAETRVCWSRARSPRAGS